jgi:polyhydroxyalkanoate synthesis regulator phasin
MSIKQGHISVNNDAINIAKLELIRTRRNSHLIDQALASGELSGEVALEIMENMVAESTAEQEMIDGIVAEVNTLRNQRKGN